MATLTKGDTMENVIMDGELIYAVGFKHQDGTLYVCLSQYGEITSLTKDGHYRMTAADARALAALLEFVAKESESAR